MDALTQILITPEAQAEIEKTRTSMTSLERAKAWPCETPDDVRTVTTLLSMVQTRLTSIEDLRTSITRPLLDAKRKVDELFKSLSAPFEETKEALKDKLASAAERHAALLVEAREAAAQGTAIVVPEGPATQWEWTYEVEDLTRVPREYLTINHAAVKLHMTAYRKSETIEAVDGIRFTRKPKVVARR